MRTGDLTCVREFADVARSPPQLCVTWTDGRRRRLMGRCVSFKTVLGTRALPVAPAYSAPGMHLLAPARKPLDCRGMPASPNVCSWNF